MKSYTEALDTAKKIYHTDNDEVALVRLCVDRILSQNGFYCVNNDQTPVHQMYDEILTMINEYKVMKEGDK